MGRRWLVARHLISMPPTPGSDETERLLLRITGWQLPGVPVPGAIGAAEGAALVNRAVVEGLLGPLVACIDSGALTAPAEVVDRAVLAHERAMWWSLMLEQRLLAIDEWFRAAGGVEYMVVKGPAVAHLDAVDPFLRSFGDLDLLVAGHSMDQALSVLEKNGAERAKPARRPGFDARFGKGVGTAFADGIQVDVHRSLCGGAHGFRIPLHRLFASPDHFTLDGRQIPAPSRTHRALHACYHAVASSSRPPIRTLRDLGWYLSEGDLTPAVLGAEARLWRGEAVLAEAVESTITTLGLDLPEWQRWLSANPVDPAERRLLAKDRGRSNMPFHWSTVRELSWPDRAAFLWGVAMPSKELLRSRNQTPLSRVVSGVKRLAR